MLVHQRVTSFSNHTCSHIPSPYPEKWKRPKSGHSDWHVGLGQMDGSGFWRLELIVSQKIQIWPMAWLICVTSQDIRRTIYTIKVRFESFQDKLGHLKSRLTKPLRFSRSVSVTLLRGWNPMGSAPKPLKIGWIMPSLPSQKQLIVIIQSNLRSHKNSSIRTVCGKTGKSLHCQNMALEKKNSSHFCTHPRAPSPKPLEASPPGAPGAHPQWGRSPARTRNASAFVHWDG